MRVSTTNLVFAALLVLSGPFQVAHAQQAPVQIAPYKDDLFGYPGILKQKDKGNWIRVDYKKKRDIYGRDSVPLKKVKANYVSTDVKRYETFETVKSDGRKIDVFRAGRAAGQRFTVIYLHGTGFDRELGSNDYIFGGNFNRLKYLAIANGGTYYAPTVKSFDNAGLADIAALIAHAQRAAPQSPIVIACSSISAVICGGVARQAIPAAMLKGIMIMGGPPDPKFNTTVAHDFSIPLILLHGSWDPVYKWQDQERVYKKLHREGYPVRFILFDTGKHGAPIRMTDWRRELNWIFAQ